MACSMSRLRLGQILILRGRGWRLSFAREPLRHLFLLSLFTLLFFLALFESLWSTTWHYLLLQEVKGDAARLIESRDGDPKRRPGALARQIRQSYQRDPLPRLPPESFRLPA